MGQTFQYPNLLTGTRSGEGWNGAVTYDKKNNYLALQGTSKSEFFMYSPPVVLHKNTDYTLHCFATNTTNMRDMDIWVLDTDGGSDSYQWIGARLVGKNPGPGGCGSTGRFASMPARGMVSRSKCVSTTTAPRTGSPASSGSATSCSWRARSHAHGHPRMGRCGRR